MTNALRFLLVSAAVATVALGGSAHARAGGNSLHYACAGFEAPRAAYGISAHITSLDAVNRPDGHATGWVGVGGPGKGPLGSNEWLQAGYAGYPSITGSDIYYGVALPGRFSTYRQVSTGVPVGTTTKVTLLEMHGRANWWRVWVNRKPVSPPIYLPHSHDRWKPVAAATSWGSRTGGICSGSRYYRVSHISIARAPGGDWQQLTG
jgi:hypothetical protein